MDTGEKAVEIFLITDKHTSARLITGLEPFGLEDYYIASGRRDLLQMKKGLSRLFGSEISILYDPVTVIRFFVPAGVEKHVIKWMVQEGGLNIPGRGTVYGSLVSVLGRHESCRINPVHGIESGKRELLTDLTGICCICSKGDGDLIGKVGLETGAGVPTITLGEGTGLRDKIGLWRVTISAEKEIVNLLTTKHHAESVMEMMIEIGALDQPGKGFIYLYPIEEGLVDVKAYVGLHRQAASIEQIVTVIDELKGGTRWRQREFSRYQRLGKKKDYLTELAILTLICKEGKAAQLVKIAMDAGAGGATISKVKYRSTGSPEPEKHFLARELVKMVVMKNQVADIVDALEKAGATNDDARGLIVSSPILKAYTYTGKPRKAASVS